jgi:2-polyprenyl-3-methyl-5-hydroxy-6-metoxy-1,4-benzoquinol methylase
MGNNNINPWDENVPYRIKELETRGDRTYWELLVPLFIDDLKKFALNSKVIDVGCGLGFLTNEIASCSEKVIGIDTSNESIKYAKNKFSKKNIEYINISILDFQDKNLHFDVCIANMVFHNISNLEENIKAIKKILNKRGLLFFSIPHPAFWYSSRKFEKSPSFEYLKKCVYTVPFQIKGYEQHPCKINYCHRPFEFYHELIVKNDFEIINLKEAYLDLNCNNNVSDILYCICKQK